MSSRLEGKIAVVTGSAKGLSAAIARRFGAEGASVVANYATSQAEAEKVVRDIVDAGGHAVAIRQHA